MGKVYIASYIQIYASTMTYFFMISNGKIRYECLRTWSLLLSTEESIEGDIGHLDDLESGSGNISDGVTLSTQTRATPACCLCPRGGLPCWGGGTRGGSWRRR